ncbi:MAG: flagellar hook-length control protein FliK [Pseudomonadota bacterium]
MQVGLADSVLGLKQAAREDRERGRDERERFDLALDAAQTQDAERPSQAPLADAPAAPRADGGGKAAPQQDVVATPEGGDAPPKDPATPAVQAALAAATGEKTAAAQTSAAVAVPAGGEGAPALQAKRAASSLTPNAVAGAAAQPGAREATTAAEVSAKSLAAGPATKPEGAPAAPQTSAPETLFAEGPASTNETSAKALAAGLARSQGADTGASGAQAAGGAGGGVVSASPAPEGFTAGAIFPEADDGRVLRAAGVAPGGMGAEGVASAVSAAPAQAGAAPVSAPTVAPTQAPPTLQISAQIQNALDHSARQITIRLYPAELGSVDVRLSIVDGAIRAVIAVERPETMELLQQDARALERDLEGAGFDLAEGGVEFAMQGGSEPFTDDAARRGDGAGSDAAAADDESAPNEPTTTSSDVITARDRLAGLRTLNMRV